MANMLVELKKLKPNPFRDFAVDPYDDDNITALEKSIDEFGFWSGSVACRHGKNGDIEIGAGHHRIKAAMNLGRKTAEVFIGGYSDEQMIRVYATENATQRGNSATAIAGSVASAVRFLAKVLTTGEVNGNIKPLTDRLGRSNLDRLRGKLETETGIGAGVILEFLERIPGVTLGSVKAQLANLKASGDYARIIKEVGEEIERENREALKALAKAEKEAAEAKEAAEKAKEAEKKAEAERKERVAAANAKAKEARDEASRKAAEAASAKAEYDRKHR